MSTPEYGFPTCSSKSTGAPVGKLETCLPPKILAASGTVDLNVLTSSILCSRPILDNTSGDTVVNLSSCVMGSKLVSMSKT
jgi:hypothetical protein